MQEIRRIVDGTAEVVGSFVFSITQRLHCIGSHPEAPTPKIWSAVHATTSYSFEPPRMTPASRLIPFHLLVVAACLLIHCVGALENHLTSVKAPSIETSNHDAEASSLSHAMIRSHLRRHRGLQSYDDAPLSAPGQIFWLCGVILCTLTPFVLCVVFCILRTKKQDEEARAEQEERSSTTISRIESNVKVFEKRQDERRMQTIRRTMKRHIFVVRREDLILASSEDDDEEDTLDKFPSKATMTLSCFRKELSSGCRICLDPFAEGETLMHSIDVDSCRHVFHEECLCQWLVKQNTTACPCCRREFVGTVAPVTLPTTPSREEGEGQV